MEKIDIQNMALVEETKTMIKQMKNEQLSYKLKEYQRKIENYREIQSQVKELKMSINNTLDKVQCNIDQKITQMENELEQSESKIQVSSFEEDVTLLSKNYKGSFSFELPKQLDKSIDDNSYVDSIQQQLQFIIKCPILIQINQTLEKTKVEDEHSEIKQLQLNSKKDENTQKTPSLNIQCNKHGKEIIMFNLNSDKTKLSRLACVECIQSNDPIKYTTINDANYKWNEYLGQTSDQVKQFQNQRCSKQIQIIQILEEIKQKYNSTISEIINKVNIQYSMFSQNDNNEQFNENMIYQMNIDQINELTEILSQTDKFQALFEKQFNIQKEDLNQFEMIQNNLGKLLQNDLLSTNKINMIIKEQSLNESVQEESHIQNKQSIKLLNLQVQHLKIYQDIIKAAQHQYEQIMLTINNLSTEFKDVQLQQFNQFVSQLDQDCSLIIKLTQFDKIQAELHQNKQDKEYLFDQIKQNENIIQLNQQMIIDFKKHHEEQIIIITDLKNQKEQLSIKLKEYELQEKQFEIKLQEKEGDLERCQKSIQKNEQIVQQLQQTVQLSSFSKQLTFSTTYKHNKCSVTQNAKLIETSSDGWQCCMCDQMIPKNGVIFFAFKIIEMSYIMIGIGFKDIVQSKNYTDCYSLGGGTYNSHCQGYCYNHDQQDKNAKQIAFAFSTNDIIIVEVDIEKKYVKWTKQIHK
ncbi:unnamed protein product [Paramecium octaurelia]|uniref:Uncharacterized protein n=1 Tax=Paramecium octaurelia TaxID=43137 RepID=A0A8S1V752_PAROT|nr:unnamed protein product [Paramecium octaurelia]